MSYKKKIVKGDKKVMNAWAFYDWANSVYPLVITTAIFPLYYKGVHPGDISVFGVMFSSLEIYSYFIAASLIMVSILSPIFSGIADYSDSKKLFMKFFNYVGAISCVLLFFFADLPNEVGLLIVMLANFGYWGSLVFYNSYLPEIAPKEEHDRLSAKGFSLGYFGSSLLLIICLLIVMLIDKSYTKYCFLLVGIWWYGFAQITYRRLPKKNKDKVPTGSKKELITNGFKELRNVWQEFRGIKRLKRFLISFFVFSMAVQTIMTMAQFFGTDAIDWSVGMDFSNLSSLSGAEYDMAVKDAVDGRMQTSMIICIILIQIIAIPGAYVFSWSSQKIGNIKTLIFALTIWTLITSSAYVLSTPTHFFLLAGIVGFVMGGIQSLSRSTYSKFLPETEDTASYFSFFDVLEKVGLTIGMISFGFIEGKFDVRYAIMSLTVFFVIGLLLLLRVPKDQVKLEK